MFDRYHIVIPRDLHAASETLGYDDGHNGHSGPEADLGKPLV